ncbi:C6 zinc finger domain-containing protein [Phlyctema vagabunda]|uniref:C6 zinc finger domain-containing protein n=1 Tax=Phlyctema vagabunda TaxID=108571 RepID=A0ABR4PYB4_9HELO
MVNVGRPSQGCFTCKQRRVKCDAAKPYCQRCTTSKRQCAGYPDVWALMHRQQNTFAQKHVQARVERKTDERLSEQALGAATLIPRSIDTGPELYSLNRFCADYSTFSGIAFFSVLPDLYHKSSENCYHEAMQAVAVASSSRQLRQSGMMVHARHHYGRAIAELNIGLRDPVRAGDDSLLVTLFMLGLFETIVAEQSPGKINPNTNCHPHSRGGLILLQYRADRQISTQLDRSLFMFFSHIAVSLRLPYLISAILEMTETRS